MARLSLGMRRIQAVLDRNQVCAIRTLEMKISDAGPADLRVEPHILGVAGSELSTRGFIKAHKHPKTGTHNWFSPARLSQDEVNKKLDELVPAYLESTASKFTASLGDPLEISIFKILKDLRRKDRRIIFFGSFDLSARLSSGRYSKTEPPIDINDSVISGPPDFFMTHPNTGEPCIIECKNVREWIYPSSALMKDLVRKALVADMTPILIARRLPFITKVALCAPAGIIAHETYRQLYPNTPYGHSLAVTVTKTRGLGYADVLVSEDPLPRTVDFFERNLPGLLVTASAKFQANRPALSAWVDGDMTWPQLRLHLAADYTEPDAEMNF